jgi:hypothetical protein
MVTNRVSEVLAERRQTPLDEKICRQKQSGPVLPLEAFF